MGDSRVFVDTNVLVYANWSGSARHQDARARLVELVDAGAQLAVSRQTLREFLVVVTRPQGDVVPMSVEEAVATVRSFEKVFDVLADTTRAAARLLDLVERFSVKGRVIHDANIVATMLENGVSRILTANPADFRRFSDLISIEPL